MNAEDFKKILKEELGSFRAEVNEKFEKIDQRFEKIDQRFDQQTITLITAMQSMLDENRKESSDRVEAAMEQSEDRMRIYNDMFSENSAEIKSLKTRVEKLELGTVKQ